MLATVPALSAESAALDEVVVTARRIEESVAHVPVAIDVTPGQTLDAGGVENLDTLANLHPGLSFESMWGGSNGAPVLRGLSQPSTAGDNVGIFVDDVFQAGRSAMDVEMLDLERVEVLRGPQNTLFGRSTFAGAIRYVAARPTADPLLRMKTQLGSDASAGVQGVWSDRIGDSGWLGRLAATYQQGDGTWRSVQGEPLGGQRRRALAFTLATDPAGEPESAVSLNFRFDDGRFALPPSSTLDAEDFNCGARAGGTGYWSYYCGRVPVDSRFSITPDLPHSRSRTLQTALHAGLQLAGTTLRSLTSYYRATAAAVRDFDGTADGLLSGVCTVDMNCQPGPAGAPLTRFVSPNVVSRSDQAVTDLSQELRLSAGHREGLDWMIGIAASWNRSLLRAAFGVDRGDLLPTERLTAIVASSPARVGQSSPLNRSLVDDSRTRQLVQSESQYDSRTLAAFGMIDLQLAPASHGRLELRSEREVQRIDLRYANSAPSAEADPAPVHFHEITPRLSVDLAPDANWYGYVSVARGARSGGVNTVPGLDPAERTYGPEFNWTAELAVRYSSDSPLLAAQLTVFHIDWRNAQILGLASTPGINSFITTNTAGITSRGVEALLRLRAGRLLTGTLAWSLVDARFRSGSDDPGSRAICGLTMQPPASDFCNYGPPRTENGSNIALVPYIDGNRTARAPRNSWNLTLQLQPRPLVGGWMGGAEATLSHQGSVFDRPVNGAAYGARLLLGTRLVLSRDSWQITFWGTNLTDDRYVRTAASRGANYYPSLPRPLDLLQGEGRRIGVSLGLDLSR